MDNATLSIILQAIDNTSGAFNQVGNSISDLVKKNTAMVAAVNQGAQITAVAFEAIGVAAIGASAYSLKTATDFQSAMTLIQTQAGASAQEVKNMSSSILDLAGQVGDTPIQLANALFYVESAGYRGATALNILKIAAEGAKVGQADLTQTTDVLTSIISSGIKGAQDFGQAMGAVNAIVGAGKMHMQDLNSALSTGILATAKNMGIPLQQVGAAIDTLVNSGMNATDASSRLNSTLQMMTANTPKVTSALAEIGLSQRQLFNDMQTGGIQKVLQDFNNGLNSTSVATEAVTGKTKMSATALLSLKNSIANTTTSLHILSQEHVTGALNIEKHNATIAKAQGQLAVYQAKLGGTSGSLKSVGGAALDAAGKMQVVQSIFGVRESTTFNSLLQGSTKFNAALKTINGTANNFQSEWQTTSQTAQMAFDKLGAQLQVVAIKFGNLLLPSVTKFVNFLADNLVPALTNTAKFFEQHKSAIAVLAGVLTALLVPALIAVGIQLGFVTFTAGAGFALATPPVFVFAGAVIAAFWPIMLIAAAVAIAAILIVTHWKQISSFAGAVGKDIAGFFNMAVKSTSDFVGKIGSAISSGFNSTIAFFQQYGKIILAALLFPFAPAIIAFTLLWDLFVVGIAGIKLALGEFGAWFQSYFGPIFTPILKGIENTWKTTWNDITSFATTAWNDLTSVFNTGTKDISSDWQKTWKDVVNFFTPIIATIKNLFTDLSNFWEKLWNGMMNFLSGIATNIGNTVKNILNNIIGALDKVIDGANSIASKVPGYIKIPDIPHFASGTSSAPGGLALVGENGPELVNIPTGSQVIPNNQISKYSNNNQQTVNVGPVVINNQMDIDTMVRRLTQQLKFNSAI